MVTGSRSIQKNVSLYWLQRMSANDSVVTTLNNFLIAVNTYILKYIFVINNVY